MDGLQSYPSTVCRNGFCKRSLRVFRHTERHSLHFNATEVNSSSAGGVNVREPNIVNVYLGKIDVERQSPPRWFWWEFLRRGIGYSNTSSLNEGCGYRPADADMVSRTRPPQLSDSSVVLMAPTLIYRFVILKMANVFTKSSNARL